MKKEAYTWLGRALLAGVVAFVLLNLFAALWYNVPVHYENADGSTEYKWEPKQFYSRGTEGFALGRTNNDGFNNLRDYTPGEKIDLLLMGSSHMEGFCVAQDENAAAVLNTLFAGERYVYNIATAAHTFPYCAEHLDRALTVYAPEVAVLELGTLHYEPSVLAAAAEGTLPPLSSHTDGLITALQKLPFLRLLYTKYVRGGNAAVAPVEGGSAAPAGDYEAALSRLLEEVSRVSAAHGVKTILVYMPSPIPDGAGSAHFEELPYERESFRRLAEENGLRFLDLSGALLRALTEDGRLTFGFSNTAIDAQQHINRHGHRLFAEAVYACVTEGEG